MENFNYQLVLKEYLGSNISKKLIIPPKRMGHISFIYNNNIYILGGEIKSMYKQNFTTLYTFNLQENNSSQVWYRNLTINSKNINPQTRDSFGYVIVDDFLYIYGGSLEHLKSTNEIWKFNLRENKNWEMIEPSNFGPLREAFFFFLYKKRYFFIHGGISIIDKDSELPQPIYNNDLYYYDIKDNIWNVIQEQNFISKDLPISRESHSGCTYNNEYYFYGGSVTNSENDVFLNDLWKIIINDNLQVKFENINYIGQGYKIQSHSCNIVKNYLLIIGGEILNDDNTKFNNKNIQLFCFDNKNMITLDYKSYFDYKGIMSHSAVYHNDIVYIFGGLDYELKNSNKLLILKFLDKDNITKELEKSISYNAEEYNDLSVKETKSQNDLEEFLKFCNNFIYDLDDGFTPFLQLLRLFDKANTIKINIKQQYQIFEIKDNNNDNIHFLTNNLKFKEKGFFFYTSLLKLGLNILITFKKQNDVYMLYFENNTAIKNIKIIENDHQVLSNIFKDDFNFDKFKQKIIDNDLIMIHIINFNHTKDLIIDNNIYNYDKNFNQKNLNKFLGYFYIDFKPTLYLNDELITPLNYNDLNLVQVDNNNYIKSYNINPNTGNNGYFILYCNQIYICKIITNNMNGVVEIKEQELSIFRNKIKKAAEIEIKNFLKLKNN